MKSHVMLMFAAFFWWTYSAEMLGNNTFETGNSYPWNYFCQFPTDSILFKTFSLGTDLCFIIKNGGTEKWYVEVYHPVKVRPGYRYTLSFSGTCLDNDSKSVFVGIGHNGMATMGDPDPDYSLFIGESVVLPKNSYARFSKTWENNSIYDQYARLYIHGGGDTVDFSLAWISLVETPIETSDTALHLNTVGYFTEGSKRAIVKGVSSDSFSVRNASGSTVYNGILGTPAIWAPTGETVRIADFSAVKTTGSCTLYCANNTLSADFTISDTSLKSFGKAVLKAFYYQRASTPLIAEFAGDWKRNTGHPDVQISVYNSIQRISSSKGWYDGSYYDKQIISSGITVYTLMQLYEHFPSFASRSNLKIPESSNSSPDLLDEVRWNLEWMLTMQTLDGGVFAKVSPLRNDSIKKPEFNNTGRFVISQCTPAALDFAAVMAVSSRLYKSIDSVFAAKCLEASIKAYTWATTNPSVKFEQPVDFMTKQYPDEQFSDEFFWASAELALATGSSEYTYHTSNQLPAGNVPTWKDVGTLGMYTILTNMHAFPPALVDSCRKQLLVTADALLHRQRSGYGISMETADFQQGSNGIAASQGMLLLYAHYLTNNLQYRTAAEQQIDYLLGRNCFNQCFVTGINDHSPFNPHHLISESYFTIAPIPGLLVGGPNTTGTDVNVCGYNYVYNPGNSWYDRYCSFATNDISILYNAPLAYCSNALEALYEGDTLHGFRSGTTRTSHLSASTISTGTISVKQYGDYLRIHFSMSYSKNNTGKCRIINTLGKVLANLNVKQNNTERTFELQLPVKSIGKGYIVILLNNGKNTLHTNFIVH